MASRRSAWAACMAGVGDALAVHHALIAFAKSRTIRRRAFQCFVLNGVVFLGSIAFFDYALRPMVLYILARGASDPEQAETVTSFADMVFQFLQVVLWLLPVYFISFVLNAVYYEEISVHAYRLLLGKPPPAQYRQLHATVTDEIYRVLLLAVFLTLSFVVYLVPIVGPPLSFVACTWLYALYCFEYKWIIQAWSLEQRVDAVENNWAYFFGFGVPCTLATFFFPGFASSGVFALLFPVFIVVAQAARPVRHAVEPFVPKRLPVFAIAKGVVTLLLRQADRRT